MGAKVRMPDKEGMLHTVVQIEEASELSLPIVMTCDSVETVTRQRKEWTRWTARFDGHGQMIQFTGRGGKCPFRPKDQIVISVKGRK